MRQATIDSGLLIQVPLPDNPSWDLLKDSSCPYGLSVASPVYLISMSLRGLLYLFLLFCAKSGGMYDVNIMPG